MIIGDVDVREKVFVVAEIGNNHEGRVEVAERLVRIAAETGVDAVKFQTFRPEHYVSASDTARFERLRSFQLSLEQFATLARVARSLGLKFISTPFDVGSARGLEPIVDAYKIASGDNNFYPLIAEAARTGKPVIVSTGVSDLGQVVGTAAFVRGEWARHGIDGELAVLHCVSSYPVPPEQASLRAIELLRERLDCVVGYSDHTMGTEASVLAVALGAHIVEKHFTLDKHYSDFRDHQLSADPPEMAELVRRIRTATVFLGRREKVLQNAETGAAVAIRRSVVAGSDLPAGHRLGTGDFTWIRPGGGLPPGREDLLIGRVLKRPLRFGEAVRLEDVE